MIEDWSGGYYRSRMRVTPYEDGPVIAQDVYNFINEELFVDSSAPVMMRLGLDAGELFDVKAENGIPRDLLALPEELFETTGPKNVFVLKSEYVDTVGEYYG